MRQLVTKMAGVAFLVTTFALAAAPPALEDLRALVADGEYEEAGTGARARLAELDAAGRGESMDAAETIDVLVESRWRNGEASEGDTRALAARSLAIKERISGPDSVAVAATLHQLAVVDFFSGDYVAARGEWERALAIRERALGPDHIDAGETANALANLLQTTGEFEAARPMYERAVAIRENGLGRDHPKVGQTLNNLAALLTVLGDYAAALPVAERSLQIKENALGPDHPQVASSLTNLADIYDQTGDRERARKLFTRAAAIYETKLGADNPLVGAALNNLAEQLRRDGKLDEARPLYKRVIANWEKAYGPEHERVALALSNDALLLAAAGELAEAKAEAERAAIIREKALGPAHPDLADSLGQLANVLTAMGNYEAARPLYERASAILKHSLGPAHPSLAHAELGLSRVEAQRGAVASAFDLSLDSEQIGRDHLRLTGRSFSEEQALRYAAERPLGLDLALSLAIERKGKVSTRALFDAMVRSRAVVLDEMGARNRSVVASTSPEVAQLAEALTSVRSRLANMTVRGLGDLEPEDYRALLDRTREDKERAERALGAASAEFAREQQRARVGLEQVLSALPPKSAIVAYVVYRHQTLPPVDPAPTAKPAPLPKPVLSMAALVMAPGKAQPDVVRLGSAETIDALVAGWKVEAALGAPNLRRTSKEADAAYRAAGGALKAAIWDPIAGRVGPADRVFVVPDGSLNLVSFSSLPAGKKGYLIESGPALHYLSAERDLVPRTGEARRGAGMLALGGPDYGAGATEPSDAPVASGTRSAGCASFDSLRFDPLPASEREAEDVVALWKNAASSNADGATETLFFHGASATEAAFKKGASGRRMLHLATHGFFLGGDCSVGGASSRGMKVVEEQAPAPRVATYISPLLLSGLALAGANRRASGLASDEDGVLTAEEIASLELSGVEWAVLSACDTGVGEIKAGEGVFGLRRAMQLAGVHTLVMSLWPVDDEATRDWMGALYRARLVEHLDTVAAVRKAGVKVLKARRSSGRSTHPFYWAAFVAAGDWR